MLCPILFAALSAAQDRVATETPATLPPEVKITGRVVTWDGKPIEGAVLRFEPTSQHLTAELLRAPHTTSAADGTFELLRRPPARGATVVPQLFVAAKGMAAVSRYVTWAKKEGQAQAANGMVQIVDEEGDEIWVDASHPLAAGVGGAQEPQYAPETKLGDIVLAAGTRLTGRVRDEAGKPLAGVRIRAVDMLEQGNALRGGRSLGFFAAAESDAAGIFTVPATLAFGVQLHCQLDGHYRERLEPVDISTSLELTMRPSGHVSGRVVDHEGRSVADATVRLGYELGNAGESGESIKTAADGTFKTSLDRPGRWRATATRKVDDRHETAHSAVLTGPKEQLEIVFKDPGKDEKKQLLLPIRVVAKGSGKPVAGFRAGSVWEEYANQNSNYLEYRLRNALRGAKVGKDGQGEIRGPGKDQPHLGVVRVVAPGFAPFTKKELEWKEPEGDAKLEPLLAELEDEATIRGRLVDETSGGPVAGAKVWAQLRQDPNQGTYNDGSGPPNDAVTTGADGTFHLRGLGEGAWEIVVQDPKRPKAPNKDVDLAVGEQKADLTISLPSGANVVGKLTGTTIGHGTKVFLSRLPKQTFGDSQSYYSYYSNSNQSPGTPADVDAEGNFRFEGVALANHLLVVRQPSPPRHGGDLYLPLEPFRVRAQGVQREFDCGEDRPGTIRGAITFASATVPHEQLVVVARLVNEDNNNRVYYYNAQYPGPRAFVGRDGTYELRVGPGTYQVQVVDLGTSLLLHNETKKIEVPTGGIAERDLKLELAAIEVEIKPAADVKEIAAFERLEVRIVPKSQKDGNRFGGNDNYDTGAGVRWPLGATKQTLVLPLGDATFFCRSQVVNLRIDDNRWENPPLGRAEFEIALGQGAKTACTIEVGASPEVPDPDKKEKEGEAGEEPATDGGKK